MRGARPEDARPSLLVGCLKFKVTAGIFSATMLIKTVLLTWGDTVSDVVALGFMLAASSRFGVSMLIALLVAQVLQAFMAYFCQDEGALAIAAVLSRAHR